MNVSRPRVSIYHQPLIRDPLRQPSPPPSLIPSMPTPSKPTPAPHSTSESPSPPIEGETYRGGVVPSTNITLQGARNLPPLAAVQRRPSKTNRLPLSRGRLTGGIVPYTQLPPPLQIPLMLPTPPAQSPSPPPLKSRYKVPPTCLPCRQSKGAPRKQTVSPNRGEDSQRGCRTLHPNHATRCPQPAPRSMPPQARRRASVRRLATSSTNIPNSPTIPIRPHSVQSPKL